MGNGDCLEINFNSINIFSYFFGILEKYCTFAIPFGKIGSH